MTPLGILGVMGRYTWPDCLTPEKLRYPKFRGHVSHSPAVDMYNRYTLSMDVKRGPLKPWCQYMGNSLYEIGDTTWSTVLRRAAERVPRGRTVKMRAYDTFHDLSRAPVPPFPDRLIGTGGRFDY